MNALTEMAGAGRRLGRYGEVAGVLAKHGFGDVLHVLKLDPGLRPERVRHAIQDLGPTFIKAGQYLSTRPDLLPADYRRELAKLQDAVAPFPFSEARRIVEEDLGRPLKQLFARFERRPLAAASIAQVHEAVLLDGTPVVVKIERPGLERLVKVDLDVMRHLAAAAERHADLLGGHRPTRLVAEIGRSLDREMDLSVEAAHAERFARQFAGDPTVRCPVVLRELSSPRVITMERLEGLRLDDVRALAAAGFDPPSLAALLARHYLEMIFVHGFFHADPHPGNLLVMPGPAIGYLDFGMAGRLEPAVREALAEVVLGVVRRDELALTRALIALADFDAPPDEAELRRDVGELMDQYAYRPIAEWRLGRMLEQLFQATSRHHVRIPAHLFLMLKALTELESLTLLLDPSFDVVSAAAPYVRWSVESQLEPRRLLARFLEAGRRALRLLGSAPDDLRELFRQARRGKLLIEFEHKGLDPALATLDKVSNRLAVAVLLGALIVGSALLLRTGADPLNGLGAWGFSLSGLGALWLLTAILRHGKL